MEKFIPVDKFERWWRKAQGWFATQFASISVDLTAVEEKVDEVKNDVADVKTAVENIDFSTLAKQGSNPNATNTAILAAIPSETYMKNLYSARFEQNNDGDDTYTCVLPLVAGIEDGDSEAEVIVAL